ncbi:hypothetical protein M9Y10_008912 [Tritrichomonas musculus]|uniref:Adenosylmethionine decarboxylase n=1 Tax=Tritrichomonas musculus TaxID=1915356 RepID=A0ABR2IZM5_9EUKA
MQEKDNSEECLKKLNFIKTEKFLIFEQVTLINQHMKSNFISNDEPQNEFEGPEKNLQIIFSMTSSSLLQVPQSTWEKMLDNIHCTIISRKSNESCTSFILSESSLFVFKDRIILKTCGTIPLLLSIDEIIQIGQSNNMDLAAVLYWRKNFIHPEKQFFPHKSFLSEVKFLDSRFGEDNSQKVQCGPFSQDHWYFYYVELNNKIFRPVFNTFEMKMHEIHPGISENFWIENFGKENQIINKVRNIIPDASVDEFFFDPCGYSMNALFGNTEEYETIHITPENKCSYVSFEANHSNSLKDASKMLNEVLQLFHPLSVIGVEISSEPQTATYKQSNEYVENCPISNYNLNGLHITFWSYIMKDANSHPLIPVAEKRNKYLSQTSTHEIGNYSGLEPPPNSNFFLTRFDNPIILI